MRAKAFILVGGLALLLGPTLGLSQFPPSGGPTKGKTKGKGGFGGGPSAPGIPGGGGGPQVPGTPNGSGPGTSGRPFPGSPGGGISGGPGGGMPFGPGSSRDPNQFFDSLARGKEVLTRAEMDPRMQGMFDRIAGQLGITNGQITRQQFQQYQATRSGGPSAGSFPTSQSGSFPSPRSGPGGGSDGRRGPSGGWGSDWSPEASFRNYDRDNDGVLNHDEMPEILRAERSTWDRDGNGFIDPNEYTEYFRARMEQIGRDRAAGGGGDPLLPEEEERKPVVHRAGRLPPGLPPWFSQLDTDGDAQVGLYEWKTSGQPLDQFGHMDRNGDGFVTVQEMLRLMAPQASEGTGPGTDGSRLTVITARSSPGGPGASGSRFGPGGGSSPGGRFGPTSGGRPPGPSSGGRGPGSGPGTPRTGGR